MQKNRILINFFSSGLQAIATQFFGGVFFYILSIYLSKDNFGSINWMNAMSAFIITILGLGLEQVVVRRIAASNRSDWSAGAFFIHSLAGSTITFLVLLLIERFYGVQRAYPMLPWFFAAQALIYIGVSLKQFLNAKEQFTPYGVIATISNLCKIFAAIYLVHLKFFNISSVVTIMICASMFELICLLVFVIKTQTSFTFIFHFKAYIKLIKESSTQYLSVIFDMSLSRIDWILLGLMSTTVALADYSFAYRAFEFAKIPMVIIAQLILPRFSKLMGSRSKIENSHDHIRSFNTVETFFAVLIPLCINILWVPVVVFITHGKYGGTNSLQFLLLSLCIPLQFFINLLWSIAFGAKRYKLTALITFACAVTNVVLNIILIPKFQGTGAAAAFLTTSVIQAFLYYKIVKKKVIKVSILPLLSFAAIALVAYIISIKINVQFIAQMIIAILIYVLLSILLKQINKQHFINLKKFLS